MNLPKWIIAMVAAIWPGFGGQTELSFNGYLEGDFLYPAASSAGRIADIRVEEGQTVAAGDVLFSLESADQELALRGAEARVEAARANLDDLATGSREAEIEVIRASLSRAVADRDQARSNLSRSERLAAAGSVSEVRVEADRTALAGAEAQVNQLTAQLRVAELPARDARRIAAEANLQAAEAEAALARRTLKERVVIAPAAGLVEKVYYSPGEVVASGVPVLRLLPPGSLVAIFFVPEASRSGFAPGDRFDLSCTGCPQGLTARLTRLADSPQYTPPIIYSESERSRLVYRAEARIDGDPGLLPGQPISLKPEK